MRYFKNLGLIGLVDSIIHFVHVSVQDGSVQFEVLMVVLDLEEDRSYVFIEQILRFTSGICNLLDLGIPLFENRYGIVYKDHQKEQNVEDRAAASEPAFLLLLVFEIDPVIEIGRKHIYE